MNKEKFLAIRVGRLDKEDALDEVDTVINEHGYCWFGKYGQKLGIALKDELKNENAKTYVVLVQKQDSSNMIYKCKAYKLLDFKYRKPKGEAYPEYYEKITSRIGTWLKLEDNDCEKEVKIENLAVKSSHNPLRSALRNSMRGSFNCYLL